MMRAISQSDYGGPEVLEVVELDRPTPRPGEVLVRVGAIGVNPADWKIRAGLVRRFGDPPFTLGLDFAGTVAALGDTTSDLHVGDDVYGCAFPPHGAYAEYVVAAVGMTARRPARLDHVHAAALPMAGLTAWQPLVEVADVQPGHRVLVHAAAGGVGHLAVQIAKARGAHVICTARSLNHGFLRDLGADELIDYTEVDFAATVRDVDVVLDPISGPYGVRSLDTLAPTGVLIDVRGTGPDRTEIRAQAAQRGIRYVEFGVHPSTGDLEQIAALVDSGGLAASVSRVLPLSDAATAHRLSEQNQVRGKLVLVP